MILPFKRIKLTLKRFSRNVDLIKTLFMAQDPSGMDYMTSAMTDRIQFTFSEPQLNIRWLKQSIPPSLPSRYKLYQFTDPAGVINDCLLDPDSTITCIRQMSLLDDPKMILMYYGFNTGGGSFNAPTFTPYEIIELTININGMKSVTQLNTVQLYKLYQKNTTYKTRLDYDEWRQYNCQAILRNDDLLMEPITRTTDMIVEIKAKSNWFRPSTYNRLPFDVKNSFAGARFKVLIIY